jgi:hypothetical protein
MKALILSLLFLVTIPSQADTEALKETMAAMEAQYRIFSKHVATDQINQETVQTVRQFQQLTHQAVMQKPKVDNRRDELLFHRMLSQMLGMSFELEEALSNVSDARTVLKKISELKLQGHEIFKP